MSFKTFLRFQSEQQYNPRRIFVIFIGENIYWREISILKYLSHYITLHAVARKHIFSEILIHTRVKTCPLHQYLFIPAHSASDLTGIKRNGLSDTVITTTLCPRTVFHRQPFQTQIVYDSNHPKFDEYFQL